MFSYVNYVGVQSWKVADLQTLGIRVEQRGNRVKKGEKREKCQCCHDQESNPDQMSVLTNQVRLKIQFRHRFYQNRLVTQTRN